MKSIFFYITVAFLVSIICVQFLDIPLAIWIAKHLGLYVPYLKTSNIPDSLFFIVVVFASVSWIAYFYLRRHKIYDKRIVFFRLTGTLLPLSFALKILLKWIFGRIDTRVWLAYPNHHYDFHWFAGIGSFHGFPSGHMLVFTPILMALWEFYPQFRFYYVGFGIVLGTSLIATEYHFLGDVLAGALIGATLYKLMTIKLGTLVSVKK